MMVFWGHAANSILIGLNESILKRTLLLLTDGGTGVSLFFVLSGFLITYLLLSEYDQAGKINIKNFYIRRALRIWPLYFTALLISFYIIPGIKHLYSIPYESFARPAYFIFFLSNFDLLHMMDIGQSGNLALNVTWSVSIEEQFYIFWPLLFVFLPKSNWLYVIAGIICFSVLFRILNYNNDNILHFHTFSVILDLGFGGLTAYLGKYNKRISDFFSQTGTVTHLILFILTFIFLLLTTSYSFGGYHIALQRVFITVLFAIIIGAQAFTKTPSVLNFRNLSFFSNMGKYTYGIYLIHPVVISIVFSLSNKINPEQSSFIILINSIVSFIIVMFVSMTSYHFFEIRFLKLKERFSTILTNKQ